MTDRGSRWQWRSVVVGAVVLATSAAFAGIARANSRMEGDAAAATVLCAALFAWPIVIVLTTLAVERAAPALSLACVAGLPWLLGSLAAMWMGDDPSTMRRYVTASTYSAVLFTISGVGLVVAASIRPNSKRRRAHALASVVLLALGGVAVWISWNTPSPHWIQATRFIPAGACIAIALAAALAGRGVGPGVALVGTLMLGLGYAAAVVADRAHPFVLLVGESSRDLIPIAVGEALAADRLYAWGGPLLILTLSFAAAVFATRMEKRPRRFQGALLVSAVLLLAATGAQRELDEGVLAAPSFAPGSGFQPIELDSQLSIRAETTGTTYSYKGAVLSREFLGRDDEGRRLALDRRMPGFVLSELLFLQRAGPGRPRPSGDRPMVTFVGATRDPGPNALVSQERLFRIASLTAGARETEVAFVRHDMEDLLYRYDVWQGTIDGPGAIALEPRAGYAAGEEREIPSAASIDGVASDPSERAGIVFLAIGVTSSAADVIGAVERAQRIGMEPILCRARLWALDKPPTHSPLGGLL